MVQKMTELSWTTVLLAGASAKNTSRPLKNPSPLMQISIPPEIGPSLGIVLSTLGATTGGTIAPARGSRE